MDYVVGSIAALISGNVTPNRPKLIRRALTPTKHPASPNVTPKSEFVEDRSIFLSPSVQKKKAIVKKSPKRIFENPDLDVTENSESSSPKADKVKKALKNELEAEEMGKSNALSKKSPSNKLDHTVQSDSPSKKSKINDSKVSNENTPKKKKRKSEIEVSDNSQILNMDVDETTSAAVENTSKSSKKMMKRHKSVGVDNTEDQAEEVTKAADQNNKTVTEPANNLEGKKKKNKKRKKKNKSKQADSNTNEDKENKIASETKTTEEITKDSKSPKKKKNKKNKNKKAKSVEETSKPKEVEAKIDNPDNDQSDDQNEEIMQDEDEKIMQDKDEKTIQNEDSDEDEEKIEGIADSDDDDGDDDSEEDQDNDNDNDSDEEISNIPNPNAITADDTDSEHDSDDEIESENEDINKKALKTDNADESSDDEEAKTKKGAKQKKKEVQKEDKQEVKEDGEKEIDTEEEIKRTLFVGNVPFSNKCKKDIKRIFSQYGTIETVRIRTVPVKDARVTPKLAVIKNEIHPDRSTVNVYVKFADPDSVERALAENNTVLNHHHLRVSRSGATGVEHDPHCAVFVGNLPFGIEDETLRGKFDKCGEILSVRIVRDKKTNAGKGFGYVNFASKDGVELALGLSDEDLTVKNRIIRVKRCTLTLSKGIKNVNKSMKPGPKRDFGNQGPNKNFGNNQGPNRNFGNNQGPNRSFGNNQGPNRNFGGNQGQRGNFQGPNRNFGNNQGPSRNFGNNQGPNRNFGNQGPRNFGNNKFGNQGSNDVSGASRRIMNKRPHQESGDGPPNKRQNLNQPPREKKQKKEFVGMTGEKKKKHKFDKGQKKKKALSEIMTKKA